MFYALMLIGIIFIILGNIIDGLYSKSSEVIFVDKNYKEKTRNTQDTMESKKEIEGLEVRIKTLEEMLFNEILKKEVGSSESRRNKKGMKIEEDSIEKYKLIIEYEKQNKSIDEIAKLLDINKGEVLLLKSLYKNL